MRNGVQVEVVVQVKKAIGAKSLSIAHKKFAFSLDETKIRSGLYFKKNTGEMVGLLT